MNIRQKTALDEFNAKHIGPSKGALSFVLIITRNLKGKAFPVSDNDFMTAKGGQVAGLGGSAIRKILKDYEIERTLSDEGGRTSRGNVERLKAYIGVLNGIWKDNALDLDLAEKYWIDKVRNYFDSQPFTFKLDPSKSLRHCIRHLLMQAVARQREIKGTMYAGAVMQHLVGAKLDAITDGGVEHHGFSVADAPSNRSGDFLLGDVSIHVTTAPTEALMRKCERNLQIGLRPLIVTTNDGLGGAMALSAQANLEDRVDVIEIEQFITTNVYEWSKFRGEDRSASILDLINRYNIIIANCESDPSLRIEFNP